MPARLHAYEPTPHHIPTQAQMYGPSRLGRGRGRERPKGKANVHSHPCPLPSSPPLLPFPSYMTTYVGALLTRSLTLSLVFLFPFLVFFISLIPCSFSPRDFVLRSALVTHRPLQPLSCCSVRCLPCVCLLRLFSCSLLRVCKARILMGLTPPPVRLQLSRNRHTPVHATTKRHARTHRLKGWRKTKEAHVVLRDEDARVSGSSREKV